jgi:fructose-bisphosphate aldolase class I
LQQPALKAWGGKVANVAAAQAALLHRAQMNRLAASGTYRSELDRKAT